MAERRAPVVLGATSLILCTRDRPELVQDAVDSILTGTAVPAELLVVDQSAVPHPSLPARAAPAGCSLRYLHLRSRGLSRARNAGIRAARHPILVFCDDDHLVAPHWFASLVGALLAAGPDAAVCGPAVPLADGPGGYVPSVRTDTEPAVYAGRASKDALVAGNMALYRAIFERIGDFDDRLGAGARYPAAEDNDFGYRLLEAGFRIRYEPDALIWHRAWRSATARVPHRWRYGYGQGAFYAKHLVQGSRGVLGLAVRRIGQVAFRIPRRLARRPRDAAGDAAYLAGLIAGAAAWLRRERAGR